MSISMSIGTPTLITISIAAITGRTWRLTAKATGSTTLSTGKASPTGIKEPRKNSTAQAHRKRLSHGRIFAVAPTPAGRTSGAAAVRAIAEEQVIAAAPAKLAVATGREQRIVVGRARSAAGRIAAELEVAAAQASSAVVEQIEAALEAAAARFKASIVVGARRGAPASAVARAVVAAEVEDLAAAVEDLGVVVEVAAAAAGKKSVE